MTENKNLYRHNDNLHETLGKIPNTIAQKFIWIICVIFIVFFVFSFIFHYPDTIPASVTITSSNPPIHLIARQNGRIQNLFVTKNEIVNRNTPIAIIENSANSEDIYKLSNKIDFCTSSAIHLWDSVFFGFLPQLGEVNSSYLSFKDALHSYVTFYTINYYPQKISVTEKQIETMRDYKKITHEQWNLKKIELQLIKADLDRDSILNKKGLLSISEYETSQTYYIQAQTNVIMIEASLKNIESQINTLHENILDLRLQEDEKNNNLTAKLTDALESLKSSIEAWKINYVLESPIDGKVVFTNIWSANQNVKNGDIVFTIVPYQMNDLLGKAYLPSVRAGKVKPGQRVKVQLDNYPDVEFGTIPGVIDNISEIPINENYILEIKFPDGLITSYHKTLPSDQELSGTAIIITEELKLIERIFFPVKKFITNGLE